MEQMIVIPLDKYIRFIDDNNRLTACLIVCLILLIISIVICGISWIYFLSKHGKE